MEGKVAQVMHQMDEKTMYPQKEEIRTKSVMETGPGVRVRPFEQFRGGFRWETFAATGNKVLFKVKYLLECFPRHQMFLCDLSKKAKVNCSRWFKRHFKNVKVMLKGCDAQGICPALL